MLNGVLDLSWWQLVAATLILTHITIATVTIYLHRAQAHRALELHPVMYHFFRFWLWLTTGMETPVWVSIHRKHHARCETEEDPHSPQVLGLKKVLWEGAELYREASKDPEIVSRYGHGTPDDWLERNLYSAHSTLGVAVLLVIDLVLFGVAGAAVWAMQMIWIPFWAAGIINGVGHYWGYRNFESPDAATNIVPWAIFIGGEELHNNHHASPSSAKLSSKWWEFDLGWLYIRLLSALGLARIKKIAPAPQFISGKDVVDMETLKAVIVGRMHVLARYAQEVISPVTRSELCKSEKACRRRYRQAKKLLSREAARLDEASRKRLQQVLDQSQMLETVYQYRQRLQQVWERTASSQDVLLKSLQEWCGQAEQTGIQVLQEFARNLRGYSLKPV